MNNGYKDYFEKAQKSKGVMSTKKLLSPMKKRNPVRSSRKTNPGLIVLMSLGFLFAMGGTFYLDEIERFLSKVEISFLAHAGAEEKPNDGAKQENKAEEKIDQKPEVAAKADETTGTGTESPDDIELNHFARLRERKLVLDKREKELNQLENEISQQRTEVEKKLKELEEVRKKISTVLEEKVQADDQKVDNLVQFYSNMKAPQAAKIIETIDEDLAVQVIAKMKKKNAADIMNLLKPEKAQMISERYVGYRK